MFDPDLVRSICRKLAVEQNSEKARELFDAIHAIFISNNEEVRVRLLYLAKRHPEIFNDFPAKNAA
jgi:hypothetical protein